MGDYSNHLEELKIRLCSKKCDLYPEEPTVSVIIPVYNIQDYIVECLDSITSQTYQNIEIIIVNDGSTDGTSSIVSIYEEFDKRIKVINQENTGIGIARQNGLNIARGKYILFVDSDDYIDKNLIEKCINTIEKHNTDMVLFGAFSVSNGKIYQGIYDTNKISPKLKNKPISLENLKNNIFKVFSVAWCKFYSGDFLRNNKISFQPIGYGEDQLFFVHSMLAAKNMFVLDENLYYYRRNRKNSITSKKLKTSITPISNFYAIEELLVNLDLKDRFITKIINKYFVKSLSWYGKCEPNFKPEYFENLKNLISHIQTNYPNGWWQNISINENDSYLSIKIKIGLAKIMSLKGK